MTPPTMRIRSLALLVSVALACPAWAQFELGEVSFPNSGASDAQEPFLRGLLLLHSFEYDDAREAFQQARQIDPSFAMAAWGEAMTHNHPIWLRQDRDAARAALADVSREGLTDREAGYLATLDVLFGDGDKERRDDLYADVVRQLAEDFPSDLDAQTFYALALLGTAHEGRDFTTYMKAAAVAEEVFDANPRHPGAAHYLIHAYDDPIHAPLGLRPARIYAEIAPAASHALHMPSHIYLALGMWDETAEMNQRSFDAAKAGTDRRRQPLNGHGWHALWWLAYAELQRDDTDAAVQSYRLAQQLHDADPNGTALAHLVRIRALLVADAQATGRPWQRYVGEWRALPRDQMSAATLAADLLAETQVRGELVEGYDEREEIAQRLLADPDASASVRATALMVLALNGNRLDATVVERLAEAARLVDASPLDFGPPSPATFPHEALAPLYLAADRASDAACLTDAVLARAPGRRITVELSDTVGRYLSGEFGPESVALLSDPPALPNVAGCSVTGR